MRYFVLKFCKSNQELSGYWYFNSSSVNCPKYYHLRSKKTYISFFSRERLLDYYFKEVSESELVLII